MEFKKKALKADIENRAQTAPLHQEVEHDEEISIEYVIQEIENSPTKKKRRRRGKKKKQG